jgi:hypothetical protein
MARRRVKIMEVPQIEDPKRTEYAPVSDAAAGSSPVFSVDLADDEEVQWYWTHYPNGQSVVTGYDIVKKEEKENPENGFEFEKAVGDWLGLGRTDNVRQTIGFLRTVR